MLSHKDEFQEQLLAQMDMTKEYEDKEVLSLIDDMILNESRQNPMTLDEKDRLRRELFDSIRKLDILSELLENDEITEIMVNGFQNIFIEKEGKIQKYGHQFSSPERLDDVIQQIVGQCNRVVNEQTPIVDARLDNGSRVSIVLKPVALNGPILSIRRFPDSPITMLDLIQNNSITREAARFLQKLVISGYSIMIGGGTSSGKTTFLNALSNFIPSSERVVTIEDNAELQIQNVDNLVRLECRAGTMNESLTITMDDLIKSALRMRPNRVIVGEIRGPEARSYISSLNLGHDGSMATAHANSAAEMITRLETMVLMGMELPLFVVRRQIASGIDILIHLGRDKDGHRQVEEITEVLDLQKEDVRLQTLYDRKDGELKRRNDLRNTQKLERSGYETKI